jgi:hypothetical protein
MPESVHRFRHHFISGPEGWQCSGMTTRPSFGQSPVDLPLAELCSARLDGEIFALGDSWWAVDNPDSAAFRARTLRPLVTEGAIAERFSAAWIYGLSAEPPQHQFCTDADARLHLQPQAGLRLRSVACSAEHTVLLGGLLVTTPLRTVADLTRHTPRRSAAGEEELVRLLTSLLSRDGGTDSAEHNLKNVWTTSALPGRPYRALALSRLTDVRALLARSAGSVLSRR